MLINGGAINSGAINAATGEIRFVAALPAVWIATHYRCYLTGAQDGLSIDLELPISSFQSRLRNSGLSYLSCVLKGADAYVDAIAARSNGQLKIWREYVLSDDSMQSFLMAEVDYETIETYHGGRSGVTAILSGTGSFVPATAETISLSSPTYASYSGGRLRYRCEIDPRLRPGDTANINGDSITVGTIVHIVDTASTIMEIAEA